MRYLFALLFVAGCGSVNLSTMAQLNQLDPITADPDGFVFAVALPEGVGLPKNAVSLNFQWVSATETIGGDFALQRYSEFSGHGIPLKPGYQLVFFDLAKAEVAEVRLVQQTVSANIANGVDGDGSMSVQAALCLTDALNSALISTYLRLEDEASFLPLVLDFDISPRLGTNGVSGVENCL